MWRTLLGVRRYAGYQVHMWLIYSGIHHMYIDIAGVNLVNINEDLCIWKFDYLMIEWIVVTDTSSSGIKFKSSKSSNVHCLLRNWKDRGLHETVDPLIIRFIWRKFEILCDNTITNKFLKSLLLSKVLASTVQLIMQQNFLGLSARSNCELCWIELWPKLSAPSARFI